MTVPNNKIKQSYAGDGVTIAFPFTNISYYLAADLEVLIADAIGVETVLIQDTDYTVTPVGTTLPYTAGTITMIGAHALAPPAAGETVVVYRAVNYTQEIDLSSGGAMPAATLEEGYDRGVMQLQQLYDLMGRTVTLPISSPVTGLSLPSPVALQHLRWNAGGTNLENMDIAGVGDLAVSTFVRTLLDETTAAAFLTAIGLDVDLLTLALPANTTISAFVKTLLDDADAAAARATIGAISIGDVPTPALPTNHLSGLAMSHAADTEHDITIAVGEARDSTDAADIVLASAITKQGDAAWSVGTNAGAMDIGSIPASGTLHVWLIKRSDTGVVDALFSISATAPTMPENYDYKRLIGSYRTNSSSNIINGDWWGTGVNRTFIFDSPILDYSGDPTAGPTSYTLSTPNGIITMAIFVLRLDSATAYSAYVSSLNSTDMAPHATNAPLFNQFGIYNNQETHRILTDTSSQIRFRAISEPSAMGIATYGYEMSL